MTDSAVLTIKKLTKIESDDDETIYRANMSGQYVHSQAGVTSIVDIKVSIESGDKSALGNVGEIRKLTISTVNKTLDTYVVDSVQSFEVLPKKASVAEVAIKMIDEFGIEGARDVVAAVQKAKDEKESE